MAASLVCRAEDVYSFRGFVLGGGEDELLRTLPYFTCRDSEDRSKGDRVCLADGGPSVMNYATLRAKEIAAYEFDGAVGQVTITINDCAYAQATELLDTMKARFGTPRGDVTLPNGGHAAEWSGAKIKVFYVSVALPRLIYCSVNYQTEAHRNELTKRKNAAAQDRTKGM